MKRFLCGMQVVVLLVMLIPAAACTRQGNVPSYHEVDPAQHVMRGDTVDSLGKNIRCIFQDTKGIYWFGSHDEGVYRYDGKVIVLFTKEHGLCDNQVRSIHEDKNGVIWLDTGHSGMVCGINYFDGTAFQHVTVGEELSLGVPQASDWRATEYDLWFDAGNRNGAYRYDPLAVAPGVYGVDYLKLPPNTFIDAHDPQDPSNPLNGYAVYTIFKDSKGGVWFGTEHAGVCHFDPFSHNNRFTWIYEQGLRNTAIRGIVEDRNGVFWFGSSGLGVYRYDPKAPEKDRLTNFTNDQGLENPDYVKVFGENANIQPKVKTGTLASIVHMFLDQEGAIWFSTHQTGLWRYDPAQDALPGKKKLEVYTTADGFASDVTQAAYMDKQGVLWVSVYGDGVYRLSTNTEYGRAVKFSEGK